MPPAAEGKALAPIAAGDAAGEPPLHVDGLRALYEQAPASLAGNAIGIVLIVLGFWPIASSSRLFGWLVPAVCR